MPWHGRVEEAGTRLMRRGSADPRAALKAVGEVVYDWESAGDTIVWGGTAADVLGPQGAAALATGHAYARASEACAAPGLAGEPASEDCGTGVAYRLRYALQLPGGHRVMVEDTGRWFAGRDGRPSLSHGALRIEAVPPSTDERSRLLDDLREGVADAVRARRQATLLVIAVPGVDGEGLDPRAVDIVAGRFRSVMRRRERLSSFAADRFAVLLGNCPPDHADVAARRFAEAATVGVPLASCAVRVGAACTPDHALDAPTLLRAAEDALAHAERTGSRVAIYAPELVHAAGLAASPAAFDLLEALNERAVVLAHQPVVEAVSRSEAFAETLTRLRCTDGTVLSGREVVAAAERAGLSLLLDLRVLELAAAHLAAHPADRLSINVSPTTLASPDWLSTLAAHLGARRGIAPRLIVEVSEAVVAGETGLPKARLDAMKALGVALAVDRFGAGRASLAHLRGVPVDILKIDGALIQNLGRSPDDRLVVRSLVEIAHGLGVSTVACWVEDEATARMLSAWGVDYLQGEHCGAPRLLEAPDRVAAQA